MQQPTVVGWVAEIGPPSTDPIRGRTGLGGVWQGISLGRYLRRGVPERL